MKAVSDSPPCGFCGQVGLLGSDAAGWWCDSCGMEWSEADLPLDTRHWEEANRAAQAMGLSPEPGPGFAPAPSPQAPIAELWGDVAGTIRCPLCFSSVVECQALAASFFETPERKRPRRCCPGCQCHHVILDRNAQGYPKLVDQDGNVLRR